MYHIVTDSRRYHKEIRLVLDNENTTLCRELEKLYVCYYNDRKD